MRTAGRAVGLGYKEAKQQGDWLVDVGNDRD